MSDAEIAAEVVWLDELAHNIRCERCAAIGSTCQSCWSIHLECIRRGALGFHANGVAIIKDLFDELSRPRIVVPR